MRILQKAQLDSLRGQKDRLVALVILGNNQTNGTRG